MPKVDVKFPLVGQQIPADHGYHLFAAISGILPDLHGDDEVGIHAINGRLVGNRLLALTDRSCLTIRIEADRIREVLPLAGKRLRIGTAQVQVGAPHTAALVPAAWLGSST